MVALIVVTHNSAAVLPGLADSLLAGLAGVDDWRVVLVDNASTDDTTEVAARVLPDADVVTPGRNAGYAAGINAGLRRVAPDETVVVLNPDLAIHPGAIAALLAALEDPTTGVSVPQLRSSDGTLARSLRREPSARRAWAEALLGGARAGGLGLGEVVTDPLAYEHAHDVDWATGAALAISPVARASVGEWDESFFLYSEEVDWCRRVRAAGLRVRFVPDAVMTHRGGDYGS